MLENQDGEACMKAMPRATERRKWSRLPLAIPVFVRSRDGEGKEFLEFATALNVSAGGMLVAVRRIVPPVGEIQLEIPSAPLVAMALVPRASRDLRAKALRTTSADGYYLLGLKFSRPLLRSSETTARSRRKEPSLV
jgi:PilZ domain